MNTTLPPRAAGRARKHALVRGLGLAIGMIASAGVSHGANHLDTPTVIMNPRADIGDLFAWMSSDGRRVNMAMTIVGHSLSDRLTYLFTVDSGAQFGRTTASIEIACRFRTAGVADCAIGDDDHVAGNANGPEGLTGLDGRVRVYAGLRDDPFFNNVRGSRAAYDVAAASIRAGAPVDEAGCPNLSAETSRTMLEEWRHTQGGPATNFLAGWTSASIVLSIDRELVTRGGDLIAVWAATRGGERQLDRMGRPLTQNALLAPLGPTLRADELKERFNATAPLASDEFVPEIERGLALYDGFDGRCGNQLLAERAPSTRYRRLAQLLADDRLWVNTASSACKHFFAVELAHAAGRHDLAGDCGGRPITQDAVDVYRSLLVGGASSGVDDGVDRDDHQHDVDSFPFLAAPDTASVGRGE